MPTIIETTFVKLLMHLSHFVTIGSELHLLVNFIGCLFINVLYVVMCLYLVERREDFIETETNLRTVTSCKFWSHFH